MPVEKIIVRDSVLINAPLSKIWEVLTRTEYIRQWDDVPETFKDDQLKPGAILEWEGYSKLTVTDFTENSVLKLNLFLPKVELDPSRYDVSYKYRLSENSAGAVLIFEIGDFAALPNPQDYYHSTIEFVNAAKIKIRELSEENSD